MSTTTRSLLAAAVALTASACTTLGPMPTTTGVSPIPHQRPGVDVQAGAVPGVHVSSMTQKDPAGSSFTQLAAAFEPDRLVGIPGLIAGGRFISNTPNQVEPYLGWRGFVDPAKTIAVAAVAFGTRSRGRNQGASLEASRIGGEVIADANLTGPSRFAELHLVGGASAVGMWSAGTYCANADGFGVDCDNQSNAPINGSISGVLPAARAGLALDFVRNRASVFHGGRLELTISGGTMPLVVAGDKKGSAGYASAGLSLTLGVGDE